MKDVKVHIGKTQVNGFFSVYDGDIYRMPHGNLVNVRSTGYGWKLMMEGTETSQIVEGWENIDGQSDMIRRINQAWTENN